VQGQEQEEVQEVEQIKSGLDSILQQQSISRAYQKEILQKDLWPVQLLIKTLSQIRLYSRYISYSEIIYFIFD